MARGTATWNKPASAIASKSGRGSSRARSLSSALDRMRGATLRAASRGDKVTSILAICGRPGHGAWRRSCQRARMRSTLDKPASLARTCVRDTHAPEDRKSTRLNSSHVRISYAVFCLKKKKKKKHRQIIEKKQKKPKKKTN